MTDQIAPSLATELEQAAKEARELGTYPYALSLGQQQHALGMLNDNADLLTRAAALARAAEKAIRECGTCEGREDIACPRCKELRALVSSEGKGE